MGLLNVFSHPRVTVREFLQKPNLVLAIALIVVFSILSFAIYPLKGMAFPATDFGISLVKILIGFFIISGIVYLAAFLLKETEMKTSFSGIASAFSLIYVFFIIGGIIGTLGIAMFVSPQAMVVGEIVEKEALTLLESNELTGIIQNKDKSALERFTSARAFTTEEKNTLNSILEREETLYNAEAEIILIGILVISLLISIIGFLIVFAFLVAEVFNKGLLKNTIIFFVLLILFGIIGSNLFLW